MGHFRLHIKVVAQGLPQEAKENSFNEVKIRAWYPIPSFAIYTGQHYYIKRMVGGRLNLQNNFVQQKLRHNMQNQGIARVG